MKVNNKIPGEIRRLEQDYHNLALWHQYWVLTSIIHTLTPQQVVDLEKLKAWRETLKNDEEADLIYSVEREVRSLHEPWSTL